jgi:hypothetical protein
VVRHPRVIEYASRARKEPRLVREPQPKDNSRVLELPRNPGANPNCLVPRPVLSEH